MAATDSTGHAPLVRVIQNPLVSESHSLTAEAVAAVLAYLAAVQPTDGAGLSGMEEMGRMHILHACIGALDTISGTAE